MQRPVPIVVIKLAELLKKRNISTTYFNTPKYRHVKQLNPKLYSYTACCSRLLRYHKKFHIYLKIQERKIDKFCYLVKGFKNIKLCSDISVMKLAWQKLC